MILLNAVDPEELFTACEELLIFLDDKDRLEETPYHLEKFINSLLDGETPKMSLVLAKDINMSEEP